MNQDRPTIKSLKTILDKFPDDLPIDLCIYAPNLNDIDIGIKIRTLGRPMITEDDIVKYKINVKDHIRRQIIENIFECKEQDPTMTQLPSKESIMEKDIFVMKAEIIGLQDQIDTLFEFIEKNINDGNPIYG